MRRTKIVCTLGPATASADMIAALVRAGMDIARLNTSHGEIEEHVALLRLVREVAAAEGRHIAVLMDLAGPKLRIGELAGGGPIRLQPGAAISLTTSALEGTADLLTVHYPRLSEDVRPGQPVLLDDGNIELRVESVAPPGLRCRVVTGGELRPRKGVAFPESQLTLPAITARDEAAIRAGVAAGTDLFALSFVREAADLQRARALIAAAGGAIPIIAKIERRQATLALDEILAAADGAMVARGDLGVELPPEDVPIQQRNIIQCAGRHLIPVITATQMLESMIDSPRPTRAESSDVANAAWDGSDALMLSGETAIGRYPIEAATMMDRIIRRAEAAGLVQATPPMAAGHNDDHAYVIALAARRIAESDPRIGAIVCFTRSGYTATLMSKVHPPVPIFAITPDPAVARRLSLARGVLPLVGELVSHTEEMLGMVDAALLQGGYLAPGAEVVVVSSMPVLAHGSTNFLKLHTVGEPAA